MSCGKYSEGARVPAQREQGALVGPRGAAQAQVDPTRVQLGEGAELLGDDEREWFGSMIRRRRPGSSRAAMCAMGTEVAALAIADMLWCSAYQMRSSDPAPRPLRQGDRLEQRLPDRLAAPDQGEVEDRQAHQPAMSGARVCPSRATRPSMWPLQGRLTVTPSTPVARIRS